MATSAIVTTYHGPTNHRQARIRARYAGGDGRSYVTVPYDHGKSERANHDDAAKAMQDKAGLSGRLVPGWMDGRNCVHTIAQ